METEAVENRQRDIEKQHILFVSFVSISLVATHMLRSHCFFAAVHGPTETQRAQQQERSGEQMNGER